MNADVLIAAFALPPESRVDQRVSKKLLVENGAPNFFYESKVRISQMSPHFVIQKCWTSHGLIFFSSSELLVFCWLLRHRGTKALFLRKDHIPWHR